MCQKCAKKGAEAIRTVVVLWSSCVLYRDVGEVSCTATK
jgi:hypothetical protein